MKASDFEKGLEKTFNERVMNSNTTMEEIEKIVYALDCSNAESKRVEKKLKTLFHLALQHRDEELREKIGKQIAIQKQLADEWTGIMLIGRREPINPHQEKLEALSDILALLEDKKCE